jgi:hypothetical protein
MSESKKKELDEAQNDQDEVGEASSDPETMGQQRTCEKRLPRLQIRGRIQKNQLNFILFLSRVYPKHV